ncbi:lipopolysaccharide biosynthesis protein [Candidatus Latescibacterota bacterium]
MTKKKQTSVGRGIVLVTTVTLSARTSAIVLTLVLIKLLGPDRLGLFLGVQSMVLVGCSLCDLGLSQGYRMLVSRDDSLRKHFLGTTLTIQAIALVLYLLGLSYYFAVREMLTFSAVLIALGALVSQWLMMAEVDLKIFRKFNKSNILTVLPVFGLAGATLLSYLSHDRLYGLAIGYASGMVVTGVVAILFLDPETIQIRFDRKYLLLIRTSVLFFFSILLYRIGQFWGLSYVLATEGENAAGILGMPLKLYLTVLIFSTSTTSVTLPVFHKIFQDSAFDQLSSVLGRLIGALWAIAGTATGLCVLCPKFIVYVLASNEYLDSVPLIPIVGIALLVKTLAVPAGNLLESRKLQWLRLIGQSISTSSMVLSVIVLLPKYGIIVVPICMLCSDCFLFLWYWIFNAIGLGRVLPWKVQLRALFAFVLAIWICWIFPGGDIAKAGLFIIIYQLFLIWFRALQMQEIVTLLRLKR